MHIDNQGSGAEIILLKQSNKGHNKQHELQHVHLQSHKVKISECGHNI